jgi:o-succinylbenzoate---CoA ligase
MKENSPVLKVLKLNFEKYSGEELIDEYAKRSLPLWAADVIQFLKEFLAGDEVSCFTSGTTGAPKRIAFKQEQLIGSAKNTLSFFELQKGYKALLPLSCKYIAGKMMVVRALVGKMNLTVIEPVSNLQDVIIDDYDFSVVIPMQIQPYLVSENNETLSKLGKILLGGSEISQNIIEGLNKLKIPAWSSFGMTETMSHFALRELSPNEQESYECLPGFEISAKFNGQLKLKNRDLGITEIQTNDVVKIFPNGRFLWRGRADNVVNSGGVKLFPESIEQKFKKLFSNLPAFVISALPDSRLGQRLVLYYEGNMFLSTKERTSLKGQFEKYECPREFISIKKFERTNSGKIIRRTYEVK